MLVSLSVRKRELGGGGERAETLDGVDPPRQAGEDRRLVAGAGADLEHAVLFADVERGGHHADDHRCADGLAAVDRQSLVGIGGGVHLRRNEQVARHQLDRRHHASVGDAGAAQAQDQLGDAGAALGVRRRHQSEPPAPLKYWLSGSRTLSAVMSMRSGVIEIMPFSTASTSLPGPAAVSERRYISQ